MAHPDLHDRSSRIHNQSFLWPLDCGLSPAAEDMCNLKLFLRTEQPHQSDALVKTQPATHTHTRQSLKRASVICIALTCSSIPPDSEMKEWSDTCCGRLENKQSREKAKMKAASRLEDIPHMVALSQRPGQCLYRPQARLIELTSEPMWWPPGASTT